MIGLLKWYYWYKNLWDEILFFWVASYIFSNYSIKKLYVEVWDKNWFKKWLSKNSKIYDFWDKIEIVEYSQLNFKDINILFLGWWEVLSDQRKFPYDWRNYLFKYFPYILHKKLVILWWIWTANKFSTRILYNIILNRAFEVVVRDNYSYNIATNYCRKVFLFEDFAVNFIKNLSVNIANKKLLLINLNSYINNSDSQKTIKDICNDYFENEKYFIPFDYIEDISLFDALKKISKDIKLYEWVNYDLCEILEFMSWAKFWVWARLHFLLILKVFWINVQPLFYQEKIEKFFNN